MERELTFFRTSRHPHNNMSINIGTGGQNDLKKT